MKKIAIVSSCAESCGNAYFTQVLIDSMSAEGYEVECPGLNLFLTQSSNRLARKKADRHIEEICTSLKDFDGVNIQFEAGLYGTLPSDITKRLKKLVNANPNISVTLHSPRLISDSATEREAIKLMLKLRLFKAIKLYFESLRYNISIHLNQKVVRFLIQKKVNIIVHTERAKEQIELLYGYGNVSVHPLKIVDTNIATNCNLITSIKKEYRFNNEDKIVGIFGFINEYKGHTLAIRALSHLPKNYKLMFFGRQHPQTIKNNELVNYYISNLQKVITKEKLEDRVFFMGEYDNEDFVNLASSVDFVWLPYVENGQDGSGIASIVFDVSKKSTLLFVLCF
ncbi:glycosyltransferase [Acerihabitans sp. KWT182]|uniref:Glycosyltransferase n=1 Tax=Acerihabitans sp. KWT182 TaxID=3157919 RepID=A0AAU7Q5X4_9GAMM